MLTLNIFLSCLISGILIGSVLSLFSLGLTLVWGVMKVVNFCHGDLMVLSAYITFYVWRYAGLDPLLSLPLIVGIMFLLGILLEVSIFDRIVEESVTTQVIVTFGILLSIRYGIQAFLGPETHRITTGYAGTVVALGEVTIPLTYLVGSVLSVTIVLLFFWWLKSTFMGIALRATAQNMEAAKLLGIDVKKMYRIAFGLGIGLAGVGGAILSTIYPIYPELGGFFQILALIIVVMGGLQSMVGTYIAGLIIGAVEGVSALLIAPSLKDVVAFILFIILLNIKPTGIFGR